MAIMDELGKAVSKLSDLGGKAVEQAKEVLKKAEKAKDINAEYKQRLHTNYAVALYLLGDMDKALALMEESHRATPCGLSYQTLGYLYVEAGDAEKALRFNQAALEYDDEDPIVLDNLAQTYYRLMDDKAEARKYFEKALEVKDDQIDTLYFLAKFDIEDKKPEAAKEKLEKALAGKFSPLNFATPEKINALLGELQ